MSVLSRVKLPKDLKKLSFSELQKLNDELRDYTIEIVSKTGGQDLSKRFKKNKDTGLY